MDKLMNDKDVCRTALATPGLLKIQHIRDTESVTVCGFDKTKKRREKILCHV